MSSSYVPDWGGLMLPCDDCGEPLNGVAVEHSQQGFGHYRRCCDCYERRQRGEKKRGPQ